ncbi:MAG: PKD domain-containing protein [Bacteroidetes bacterium]|nr:PKD domain-containing protein [Bacteroidota bacterium]
MWLLKNITVGGANTIDATFTMSNSASEVYQDVTFSNSTPNAVDYEWEFGDGTIITGVANPVYSFSEPGVYTVTLTVTNSDGCTSTSTQTITISESTTGLQNLPDGAVNIFSFRNYVAVDFSKLQAVDATIQVFNLIGQEISNEKFSLSTIYRKDILDVEAAYVIVKVKNGNGFMTKKVFVSSR